MKKLPLTTTQRCEAVNITELVKDYLGKIMAESGSITVHSPHTTCAVTINEKADPAVAADILTHLERMIPKDSSFTHAEGNSDAHIKSSLVGSSQTVIVEDGTLQLGTWQGIFFLEFDGPRKREVWLKFIPDVRNSR